ncbi:LysM domain-containing protein [Colletotrichum eremochloae]|nr:LysM domain-containing protein [Colletotrichum eremochloae]
MELSNLISSPLWVSALASVGIRILSISHIGVTNAQQFADVTLGHDAYPGLSDTCYEALNTTVGDCPGFVAVNMVEMPRLASPMLEALCTPGCKSSLASVRSIIASGCAADTDVIAMGRVVYPATYTIDRIMHAYDVSCARDSTSGMYCDEIYHENLANETAVDGCSDCALGVGSILLNSPFGYDAGFAADFQSQTASCGSAGYDFTSPAPYAVSTKPPPPTSPTTAPTTCGSPYIVQPGDTCDSIATAKGVSTHSVIKAGRTGTGCANLGPGKALCLPEPCTLYRVKWDDTCRDIIAAVPGLRSHDLLTWNPNINPLCTNMVSMYEHQICVSPPGRSLDDVTTITTAPPTVTQPASTIVPRPSNAKAESHQRCAGWYEVKEGDYCQLISIRNAIELRDFFFLNPSVDDPDCTDLWLETSYCVKAVGDINTYSGYPYSTTPLYTLTPSSYVTTTRPPLQTVAPSATPIPVLPLAAGSQTETDGCLRFAQYRVVPVQQDQSEQTDVPSLTKTINSCDYVSAAHNVLLEDMLAWNPSLEALSPCTLQRGLRYCVAHSNATERETSSGECLKIAETEPGTIDTCSCFTLLNGFDAGSYLCEDIVQGKDFTVSDLVSWNPWIGSEGDCDAGLYAGLAPSGERALCISGAGGAGGGGGSPPGTDDPVTPPGPTQPGIVEGCRAYYLAVAGDGCWTIADGHGISLEDLYAWNPALNGDCSGLWSDYAYCIEGPVSSGPAAPPGPTQPGVIETCRAWHLVTSGQGCWDIQQLYSIPDYATFQLWNPALGDNCGGLWLDYAVCVGV